ncbi:YihY/virulence factor BrkB family protein [Maridesulfovibrio salexigens]|uniref:Ribonuclease BN n=1 Tax=Maridesulfovibrio salexigens (strain ATCC 14822 / DSM 2638 / NCIMB 8403 / VKM B-1763) TaxID=526222 RepID=C6BY36_MARSD|nr:YihY/virulence factor BrkB family protein [Maridesulfovibrio salexigens]ACS80566.1 ribonuclease BN [Maridesulfovibrio salexigens DSM 2638]
MTGGKVGRRISEFFLNDIWDWSASHVSGPIKILHTMARVGYLVTIGFLRDQCIIRASALTFTTMLSIVPFLAVAFSLMKGMGFQDSSYIQEMLLKVSAGREEVVGKILEYVDNTNVQTLGWIGVATLLFTVLSTVGTVEKAFNIIWKVSHGRTFWRKFTDFFSVIFICPVAVIVATSVSVSIKKQAVLQQFGSIYGITELESFLISLAPLVLIWLSFTFIYAFMPNTKVRITSALAGGVVAGTVWQMAQWAYINWQIGVTKYNAIYGSFAQLPLFLVWLYASWVIVLLGSEISYAVQNVMLYRQQKFMPDAGVEDMQKFSLLALSLMTMRFENSEHPYDLEELAGEIGVPVRFISPLLDRFVESGILIKGSEEGNELYSFAVSPRNLTMLQVMGILSGSGKGASTVVENPGMLFVAKMFDDIKIVIRESGCDTSLSECAENMDKFLKKLPAAPEDG